MSADSGKAERSVLRYVSEAWSAVWAIRDGRSVGNILMILNHLYIAVGRALHWAA